MTTTAVRARRAAVPRLDRLATRGAAGRRDGGRAEDDVAVVERRTACPAATPRTGSAQRAPRARRRRPSTTAGTGSPCARSWTSHSTDVGRRRPGRPHRTDRRPPRRRPARRAGPTVTVLVTGVIDSTYRGRPSGAGRPSRRPSRWPTVKRERAVVLADLAPRCRRRRCRPARSPSRRRRKPRVSPSAMKQMSCESGLSATASPRAAASARTSRLGRVAEREDRRGRAGRGSARPARTTGPWPGRPSGAAGRRRRAGRGGR